MSSKKTIRVKCYRCNPAVGEKPQYKEYNVPIEPLVTVMDVLDYIYENLDSTISYFTCCRRGTCGRCTVMVNGKPGLSCLVRADKDITIEPISKDKVVKDLIVEDL